MNPLIIKLDLKYQGTRYHGYQKQIDVNTIQKCLEFSLKKVYRTEINVLASGRTDTGVHAEGQVVHYQVENIDISVTKLPEVINCYLPEDIRVYGAEKKNLNFHARYSARVRQYRYRLWTKNQRDIPLNELAFIFPVKEIDSKALKNYLSPLIGYYDFTSFCHVHDSSPSKQREIFDIQFKEKEGILIIDMFGNAFLHNMVRSIIGTALFAFRKNKEKNYLKKILLAKDASLAKHRAPAKGLCLQRVFYTKLYGERDYYRY